MVLIERKIKWKLTDNFFLELREQLNDQLSNKIWVQHKHKLMDKVSTAIEFHIDIELYLKTELNR